MKMNYLKKGLSALVIVGVLGYSTLNAQTKVTAVVGVGTVTLDDDGAGGTLAYQSYPYNNGTDEFGIITMTGTAIVPGQGTFDVSFKVKPAVDQRVLKGIGDPSTIGYFGVVGTAPNPLFRGNQSSFCTIEDITYSNFTGSMTSDKISSSTLKDVVVVGGTNGQDRFAYQVGSTEYISTGNTGTDPKTYDLLTYGPVEIAGGSALTSLTSVIIRSASTRSGSGSDAWGVESLTVEVTLDNTTLGVNDFEIAANNGLIVSPNPVVDTITLNMIVKSAEFIDMTGRTVKSFNGETESLDVSGLVSGIYILKVMNQDGKVYTKKIIK